MSEQRHLAKPVYDVGGPTRRQPPIWPFAAILAGVVIGFLLGRWTAPSADQDIALLQSRLQLLTEEKDAEIANLSGILTSERASFRTQAEANALACDQAHQELQGRVRVLEQVIIKDCQ